MEHATDFTGIAIVALAATLCGMALARLKQPPIVGYILAGVILGPSGFALVQNRVMVGTLAEAGVLMLLYFIGMELSLRSFRRLWKIAVGVTAIQIAGSFGVMYLFRMTLGWAIEPAVLFAFVLALSSTAVAVRMLEETDELRSRVGKITVGVLIAQDLAVAPMLLVLDGMSREISIMATVAKLGISIGLIVFAVIYFSQRRSIELPLGRIAEDKKELVPLAALTGCFGFAALAGLSGLSPAFGAFMAGLLVGNSRQRQLFFDLAKPIENILLMVFFLSIGLLIDLGFVWDNIGIVLVLWFLVTVFKTILNAVALHMFGETWQRAFLSSLILAQIGEFSFVLGAAALDNSIIASDIHKLIVALTVVSLITSPLWLVSMHRLHHRAAGRIDNIGRLTRFVFHREWRYLKRFLQRTGERSAEWFEDFSAGPAGALLGRKAGATGAGESGTPAIETEPPPATENSASRRGKQQEKRPTEPTAAKTD
jgi:CPA2 family monovalent cation:H+ antiporter-2